MSSPRARAPGQKPAGPKAKEPRPAGPKATRPSPAEPGWIAVAEIARPHGVRGELRLRVYSGDPALLLRRPPIKLRKKDGEIVDARIRGARPVDRALLVELEGVSDRNAAEDLRGVEVLAPRAEFAPLEEGEFYACDIEGARAELVTGEPIGTVTGLGTYPTCDVLLVDRDGQRLEVPLLPQFVDSVDTEAKLVKILTLEGLS